MQCGQAVPECYQQYGRSGSQRSPWRSENSVWYMDEITAHTAEVSKREVLENKI